MAIRIASPGDAGYVSAIKDYFIHRVENTERLLQITTQKQGDFTYEILLLCCCAIDGLANLFLIDDERERLSDDAVRFRKLLWRCGAFKGFDFRLVNMVELGIKVREFAHSKQIELPSLIAYIRSEHAKHNYPIGNAWEQDLPLEQVKEETESLIKGDGRPDLVGWLRDTIDKTTHAGVLYEQYRCSAVHKMRVENHWTGARDPLPFYMGVINGGVDFTFPEHYLILLVRHLLESLLERCYGSEIGVQRQ